MTMNEPSITCPKCKAEFPLTETLARPYIDAERAKIECELHERTTAIGERESALKTTSDAFEEEKRNLELNIRRRIEAEREIIRDQVLAEEQERYQTEIAAKDQALSKLRKEVDTARRLELEIRRQREALEERERAFELEVARKVDEERETIRQKAQSDEAEQHRLKLAQKDKIIEQMAKQVDELRRKIEQGSQQLQGEVLEADLRQTLELDFREDEFEDVPNGQPGSDIIQRVRLANGACCGSIVWESKNTKHWNDAWLAKLRKDQRDNKADLAVIVSIALPKSVDGFNLIDGVWVAAQRHAVALAKALRQALIDLRQARIANENRESSANDVYTYITSAEFPRRIGAMVESYSGIRRSLDAEKVAMNRAWAKREKELDGLIVAIARLYGDLEGIVGKSMPEVEALKTPQLEIDAGHET
jgi:hypothetical protein